MVARRPAVVAPELQLAPFFRARRRKTSLCSGALERSCVSLSCDLAVSSELKVSPITRKSGPQPNVHKYVGNSLSPTSHFHSVHSRQH